MLPHGTGDIHIEPEVTATIERHFAIVVGNGVSSVGQVLRNGVIVNWLFALGARCERNILEFAQDKPEWVREN